MYENTNSSIDWKGIFLKVIIAFLVIVIAITGIKTFTKGNTKNSDTTNVVESNLTVNSNSNVDKLLEAGKKYYKDNNAKLPKDEIKSMVTLNDLIKAGVINTITDADGKACDVESSYVTAEKSTDPNKQNDYTIKANLVCGESYNNATAYLGENDSKVEVKQEAKQETLVNSNVQKPASSNGCGSSCTPKVTVNTEMKQTYTQNSNTNTNSNATNNNSYVSKRSYIVSFDSNGGTCSYYPQNVNEGEYAYNPGNCNRDGYQFSGWRLDGRAYNFNTPVTRDIKLVAYYTRSHGFFEEDFIENNYDRYGRGYVTTTVYSMGWAKSNIKSLTINHVLDVEPALESIESADDIDSRYVTDIRISNIEYSRAIDTQAAANHYRNAHARTFLNSASARVNASTVNSKSSLGYVRYATFNHDRGFVDLYTAERNGFDVTWITNDISSTCKSPFPVTLNSGEIVDDVCNFGIVYKVTWEYKYEY